MARSPAVDTVAEMLPEYCDPGYALLGIALGAQDLAAQADAFGYNEVPPIDLPGAVASFFPKNPPSRRTLRTLLIRRSVGRRSCHGPPKCPRCSGYREQRCRHDASPHVLHRRARQRGGPALSKPPWKTPLTPAQAAQMVPLMRGVVDEPIGTAYGVGFLPEDQVAAKTGTAQVGNNLRMTRTTG